MVGIYKITSPSGRVYIGQSKDIVKRWARYKDINSAQRQPLILSSFKKYGISNHVFEVIHELPKDTCQDVIDAYEILYIEQYRACGFSLLNIKEGGLFGSHGESTKKKIGASKIGNKNRLGKFHSDETKSKISKTKTGKDRAWNKGIPWPEEVRDKMYKFPKGHIPYNKGKEHKHHTEESRKTISETSLRAWKYRKENGILLKTQINGNPKNSKLDVASVLQIKKLLKSGNTSQRIIGNMFNIAQVTVGHIKNGKIWKHIKID